MPEWQISTAAVRRAFQRTSASELSPQAFNLFHILAAMLLLQTERLEIHKMSLADAPFILELVNSPGWLSYIGDRNVHNLKDAEAYLQKGTLKSYADHGFGFYTLIRKSDGKKIGTAGLIKRDMLEHVDVGFALLPEYEGQGLAGEASLAIMDYARQSLGLTKILAITVEENHRSRKLLEKLGLHFDKEISWPETGEKLLLYST